MSRIEELQRKLKAREGKSEYADNVVALKAEIERLLKEEKNNV
jgi:hypothetical protein